MKDGLIYSNHEVTIDEDEDGYYANVHMGKFESFEEAKACAEAMHNAIFKAFFDNLPEPISKAIN